MSDRNEFTCAARGCDGCAVCAPEKGLEHHVEGCDCHKCFGIEAGRAYPLHRADTCKDERTQLQAENARLREALKKIADGGVGTGELATPVERMIAMSEIAQDALEWK